MPKNTKGRSRQAPSQPDTLPFNIGHILGATLALSILVALPSSTLIKAAIVTAGAVALIPWVVPRVRAQGLPRGFRLAMLIAAWGLPLWAVVSAIASQAPWTVSIFGWFGRDIGILVWIAAAIAFTSALYMAAHEVRTTIAWVGAAAIAAGAVAIVQAAGWTGLTTSLGYSGYATTFLNPNFASAFFGVMIPLSVALWPRAGSREGRTWFLVAVTAMSFIGLVLAGSDQGYVAALVGTASVVVALGISSSTGRARLAGWLGAVGMAALGALIIVATAARLPLPGVTRMVESLELRLEYWKAAIGMLIAHPVFGTGPDGYGRYFAEYRTPRYVEMVGPTSLADAAHSIPLNVAATLGLPGLALWLVVFLTAAIFGLVALARARATRPRAQSLWLLVGVWTGLLAYLVQASVSIDQPSLTLLGWFLGGSVAALSENQSSPPVLRNAGTRGLSMGQKSALSAVGAAATFLVFVPAALASLPTAPASPLEARERALNVLTPCPLRLSYLETYAKGVPPTDSLQDAFAVLAYDPRCPSVAALSALVAAEAGDLALARDTIAWAQSIDPLNTSTADLAATIREAGAAAPS